MPELNIRIIKWAAAKPTAAVTSFLKRPPVESEAERVARKILEEVRARGDRAVVECVEKYDGCKLSVEQLEVSRKERLDALKKCDAEFKRAAREAHARITRFARSGLRKDWTISSPKGGWLGEQFTPLDRVGVYVPAGMAPLASTALMTVTLAKVAGVPEVVACAPANKSGQLDPALLFALDLAGTTEIFKVGGIQAIGAMAYGTKTIRKVRKIVGPGGPYVTAAKKLVYGEVALDLVAGPSEIAVLADETAPPAYVAADLLSQAEHGTGSEKALLVTSSEKLAAAVREELMRQAERLGRKELVRPVLENGTLLVVVDQLDLGIELCNQFAPEHLEIIVREPGRWLKKVRSAGAVFVGPWSPESAGDFAAGPSHVLPTGGAAAMFSGLTVEDFRRRTSIISFTRADLKEVLPVINAFARVEGLDGHARSAQVRFEKET
ncbi:MAG: histidinol dehydrogenase [Kiritimatiellae bacterium]|nr:histidinol dehydrogenase [Kiritimatiellia bacterium]